jgi:hypothetical protein
MERKIMKTRRLLTIIAALSTSLSVFLIASNSTILGDEKASESTARDLLTDRGPESRQGISPTVPQIVHPSHPLPNVYELLKGSVRREVYGIPYNIIPLQDQNVDK